MTYAMCPDDGLPRLYRRVPRAALPAANLICALDRKQNILLIDGDRFDALSKTEQHIVLRTQRAFVEAGDVLDTPSFPYSPQVSEAAE